MAEGHLSQAACFTPQPWEPNWCTALWPLVTENFGETEGKRGQTIVTIVASWKFSKWFHHSWVSRVIQHDTTQQVWSTRDPGDPIKSPYFSTVLLILPLWGKWSWNKKSQGYPSNWQAPQPLYSGPGRTLLSSWEAKSWVCLSRRDDPSWKTWWVPCGFI